VLVIAAALVGFQLLIQAGLVALDRRVPTVLILAGVIFSTLHQSSLGTVFLMAPRKLSPIWYSPMLPVIFLVSAVMTGMAMVIVEATLSARYFRREPETELLRGVGRALLVTLGLFLTLRTVDLVARGAAAEVLALSPQAFAFWLEFGLGLILPLAILASARAPVPLASLFWSSALVVVGLVIHRFNVVVTGYGPDYFGASYRPHWMEVAISVGAIAAGILIYGLACRHLPILETHPGRSEA
jgi:formate dehydrogenase iron-sulfur subunit